MTINFALTSSAIGSSPFLLFQFVQGRVRPQGSCYLPPYRVSAALSRSESFFIISFAISRILSRILFLLLNTFGLGRCPGGRSGSFGSGVALAVAAAICCFFGKGNQRHIAQRDPLVARRRVHRSVGRSASSMRSEASMVERVMRGEPSSLSAPAFRRAPLKAAASGIIGAPCL